MQFNFKDVLLIQELTVNISTDCNVYNNVLLVNNYHISFSAALNDRSTYTTHILDKNYT